MKEKELTRILCQWNRKGIDGNDAMLQIWRLYEKEALETWNDPLESLLVDSAEVSENNKTETYRVGRLK